MYYRLRKDNLIVDAIDVNRYVWMNPRNGIVLLCDEEFGQGILSYDGSTIYQLNDKELMNGDYDIVTLEEIDEAEFRRLRELLDGEETPIVPDEPEVQEPMSVAEMRTKIKELEEQLAATKILLGVE